MTTTKQTTATTTATTMVETMTVGQRDTLAALQILVSAGVPVLLWGDPGTGKTATIERYAAEAGWSMRSVIASLHDPTDFSGLPVRNGDGDGVVYVPPRWARRIADDDGVSLVFLDEVNTATPATQNALMRVVQEGRVGELDLGANVRFVAAANPVEQNSGAWDLSAPLANRFAHLTWPLRLKEWKAGYLDGWPELQPLDIGTGPSEVAIRRQRRLQTEFLVRRPALLCDPPDPAESPRGWPSPRSWDRLAVCLAAVEEAAAGDTVAALIAAALVGEPAAAEYLAYLDSPDLPDPEALIDDPAMFAELDRSDQRLAALDAVADTAIDDPGLWSGAFRVCIAAADAGCGDIAAVVAMRLVKHKPSTQRLPAGHEAFAEILIDAGLLEAPTPDSR